MTATPTHIFDASGLLDRDTARNGPLEVYIGQDGWIEPADGEPISEPDYPPDRLLLRLLRFKPWRGVIRIAPADPEQLAEFGDEVAKRLGIPVLGTWKAHHRAVWLPFSVRRRTAASALGSTARVFEKLAGLKISQAQVRVERW